MECRAVSNNSFVQCQLSSDCGDPPDLRIGLCNTTTGICSCILTACYDYNNRTNHCDLKACHAVEGFDDDGKIICINRGGKSKRKALLLNMISFTGATNFYLGNYLQACIQTLLFILFLAFCGLRMMSCLYICCRTCCNKKKGNRKRNYNNNFTLSKLRDSKEEDQRQIIENNRETGEVQGILHWIAIAICSFSCFDCLSTLLSGIELGWMIYDFIMIGINGKLDGSGCLLEDDTVNLVQEIALQAVTIGK